MTTAAFFRSGLEAPFVQGVKSDKYSYSVRPNLDVTPPTLNDAEIRLTSSQVESLKDRVQVDPKKPEIEIVDKFFRLEFNNKPPRKLALECWGDLQRKCKVIGFGSGFVAVSLTLIALRGAPIYVIVALYVGTVASTCLAGWSLHRYHLADKQLAFWQSPGEDFAQKRKTALGLPLHEMIQKKCHFHPEQLTGTLFAIEILSVFRRDFKHFATPLLDRKCDTPALQHQWVLDFFKGNPFAIKFFADNPHLSNESGWDNVQKFQIQIDQLIALMTALEKSCEAQSNTNQEAAKNKYDTLQKGVLDKGNAFCERQQLAELRAQLYFFRVLPILNEECLSKIHALYLRDNAKANSFGSLVYPQVRALLEEANKGLLQDQAYTLDATVFADPAKYVTGNFQEELDAITVNFPKNVIDKAKAIDSLPMYHQFIDAAFSP